MKTVAEIAEQFGVTKVAVYNWMKDGLQYKTEKIIGRKPQVIIDPNDVVEYHKSKEGKWIEWQENVK